MSILSITTRFRRVLALLLLLVGTLFLSPYVSADDDEWKYGWAGKPEIPDEDGTLKALAILFDATHVTIPETSSCWSHYLDDINKKPKIKDMLAMRMTTLFKGQIVIEGKCESGFCLVGIWQDGGEEYPDLASTTQIKFGVKNGKLNPAKLACHFSP
jgi:hypothetical protein